MRTAGVDLAAEPATTAIAVVDWQPGSARVVELAIPADDKAVLDAAKTADKVGIDCPLGWPDTFVRFLRSFHEGSHAAIPPVADSGWRRSLAYRVTDARVRADLKLVPLSVSTDRIGLTAMRAARVQALLADAGHEVDRTGHGLIVEVYPAAGLLHWGVQRRPYKGSKNVATLDEMVTGLPEWLDLGEHEERCRQSDHAFDAVISALLARAAALGLATSPSEGELAAAVREGWIAVPTCELGALIEIRKFEDDDEGYLAWHAAHPDLFVINAERSMNPNNLVLHRATCHTISGTPARGSQWTGPYVKVCGGQDDLEREYPTARICRVCLA